MKILKIWPSFQTELKYHDHYLSEIMQEDGVVTTFLSSDKTDKEFLPFLENKKVDSGESTYNGSKIIRLKSIEIMRKPFIVELKKMYQLICKEDFDLIHIFGIGNPITMLTLSILKFCKKKTPVVINDHSNPLLGNASLVGRMYYKANIFMFSKTKNQVRLVIVPNLASKNFVQNHYGLNPETIQTIPLGYDANIFRYEKSAENKSQKLIVGFAGKILPGKRLETLIDVLSEIDNSDIDCKIVGMNEPETEYQQELREYANNKHVDVTFSPLIKDPNRLAGFYNGIDIAVFPGSISITTLEANGCGTPVLLYRSIEGLEDRVEGNRGFLFDNPNELETLILHYKNLKRDHAIPRQDIEKESHQYSWQEISKIYMEVYNREIISSKLGL